MLTVKLDEATGDWVVLEEGSVLDKQHRLQDARASARAKLLERGKGSAVIYTPSGRPREKLSLHRADGRAEVQVA